MVNGPKHCFTPTNVMYSADTTGTCSFVLFFVFCLASFSQCPEMNVCRAGQQGTPSSGEETMAAWIKRMPLNGNNVSTKCYGNDVSQSSWSGNTYCDAALAGKTFA